MLSYVKPRIGKNAFGGGAVTYMGVVSTKKWERIGSYGPKFVERSDVPDVILVFENTAPDGWRQNDILSEVIDQKALRNEGIPLYSNIHLLPQNADQRLCDR